MREINTVNKAVRLALAGAALCATIAVPGEILSAPAPSDVRANAQAPTPSQLAQQIPIIAFLQDGRSLDLSVIDLDLLQPLYWREELIVLYNDSDPVLIEVKDGTAIAIPLSSRNAARELIESRCEAQPACADLLTKKLT